MEHFLETWGYLALRVEFYLVDGTARRAEVAIIYGGCWPVVSCAWTAPSPIWWPSSSSRPAEVLESLAGYLIGYFGGRTLVDRLGRYVLLTHKGPRPRRSLVRPPREPFVFFGRFIPLCARSCPSRPGWVRWPSQNSSSSPPSAAPSGVPALTTAATS